MKHIEKIEDIKGMPSLDCPYLDNDDYSDEELVINSLYSIIRTIESSTLIPKAYLLSLIRIVIKFTIRIRFLLRLNGLLLL